MSKTKEFNGINEMISMLIWLFKTSKCETFIKLFMPQIMDYGKLNFKLPTKG